MSGTITITKDTTEMAFTAASNWLMGHADAYCADGLCSSGKCDGFLQAPITINITAHTATSVTFNYDAEVTCACA